MSALRPTVRFVWSGLVVLAVGGAAMAQEMQISAASRNSHALFERARDAFHRAWFERANELFDETLSVDPDLAIAQAYKAVAESFLSFDPLPRAARALELSVTATPGEQSMVAALAAFAGGDYEEAAVTLRGLIEQFPEDSHARHALGFTLVDLGMPRQGLEVLLRLIHDRPGFFAAWNHIGYAYLDLGDVDRAEQAMARFISSDPSNPSARDSWADVMTEAGRLDEAVASLTRAVLLEPGYAYGIQHLGDVLVMEGHLAMARRAYEWSVEADTPYSPRFELLVRERIASSWLLELQYDRAVAALESVRSEAVALTEGLAALAALRAQLTIRLSTADPEAAATLLAGYADAVDGLGERAAEHGEPAYLYFFMGWHAVSERRLADAEALLEELETTAEGADSIELLLGARLLGEISLARLDYSTAVEAFEVAGGDNPLVAVRLALAYEGDGKPAAAAALFNEAVVCPGFDVECALATALAAPLFDPSLAIPDFGLPPTVPDRTEPEEDPDEGAVRIEFSVLSS